MRRSKEDAAKTREEIVASALDCFDRHGIGGSTIAQIADRAGVSKGAVYHHFAGKRDILRAIREQVALPLLDEADTAFLQGSALPALERIERFLASVLDCLAGDPRLQLALGVMQFRCEYVAELAAELDTGLKHHQRLTKALETAYREAALAGQLAPAYTPQLAALDTATFLSGLVRQWLLQGPGSPLRRQARELIGAHVAARRV